MTAEPTQDFESSQRPARARDADGSLPRSAYRPRPLGPDSLTWKFYGDKRRVLLGGRAGTTENMYPQLGQAVSDHSVIFSNLAERVRRSDLAILDAVYGTSPAAVGIKIRNFHKPLQGLMSDGSKYDGTPYKGLDPETFYWAHATFLDMMYTFTERFIRPLTPAEKEQLFQESRDWYSLYGVDDSAQPSSYAEFVEYWDRNLREELVGHTKVARYTVGYVRKGITRAVPQPAGVPPWLWNRVLAPTIDRVYAFIGAGGLDPILREKLDISWTGGQQRRYRLLCATFRALNPLWERLAPTRWRYVPQAAEAFAREGVDPRDISARSRSSFAQPAVGAAH